MKDPVLSVVEAVSWKDGEEDEEGLVMRDLRVSMLLGVKAAREGNCAPIMARTRCVMVGGKRAQ